MANPSPSSNGTPTGKEQDKGSDKGSDRTAWLAKRKKASAMRQSVAHESKAATLIGRMLEDAAYGSQDEFEQRPGGAQDPWRKALGPLHLGKTGGRAMAASAGGEDREEDEDEAPTLSAPGKPPGAPLAPKKPLLGKHSSRFSWTPTSESVHRVLGRRNPAALEDAGEELSPKKLAQGTYR